MNIEIANRLVQLRKEKGLSQEQLAERIGVSRQAVSKWERSEASPDTDNLIMLARLYEVSLDALLRTDDEIPLPEPEPPAEEPGSDETAQPAGENPAPKGKARDKIGIGGGAVRFTAKNGDVVSLGRGGLRLVGDDPATAERERRLRERIGRDVTVTAALLTLICVMLSVFVRSGGAFLLSLAPIPFLLAFLGRERRWVRVLYTVCAAGGASFLLMNGGNKMKAFGGLCFLLIPLYYRFVAFLRLRRTRVENGEPRPAPSAYPFCDFLMYHAAATDLLIYAAGWGFSAFLTLTVSHTYTASGYLALCLIPIFQSLARAIRERNPDRFSAEAALLFGWLCFGCNSLNGLLEHLYTFPVLLLAPLYHWLCRRFMSRFSAQTRAEEREEG